MLIARKLRRLGVIYTAWNRDWADMRGRLDRGQMHRLIQGPTQQLTFISKAPRVFPDKESLHQFLERLSAATGSEKILWSAASPIHTQNQVASPAELADAILALPERGRGYLYLSTPGIPYSMEPPQQTTEAKPQTIIPGQCAVTLGAPPNWDNGNDAPAGLGSIHSVEISVTNTVGDHQTEVQIELIIEALRMYTESPSKADLRKLKPDFPIAVAESRQTSAQRKWESRIQRKAVLAGAVTAFVVGGGLEIIKAIFAPNGGK